MFLFIIWMGLGFFQLHWYHHIQFYLACTLTCLKCMANGTIFISAINGVSVRIRIMVLKATFNNISVTSWRSVLLVEEPWEPGKNTNRSQVTEHFITYCCIECTLPERDSNSPVTANYNALLHTVQVQLNIYRNEPDLKCQLFQVYSIIVLYITTLP
jgi:hypothetical protein